MENQIVQWYTIVCLRNVADGENTQQDGEGESTPPALFMKHLKNSLERLCNQCGSIALHRSTDSCGGETMPSGYPPAEAQDAS